MKKSDPVALGRRLWISKDTIVVTFGLADASKPLGLSTCACVLARGGADAAGEPFVRPYTPVSTNALAGKFQLMMKVRSSLSNWSRQQQRA